MRKPMRNFNMMFSDGTGALLPGPVLAPAAGKTDFVAWQASSRGGLVRVRLEGERVILGGQGVTVLRGELA